MITTHLFEHLQQIRHFETFALLIPEEKRRLVSACAASVAVDGQVTARESELFRVVGDWLGAPVPPLLPGQLLS